MTGMGHKRWIDAGIAGTLIIGGIYLYVRAREFPMGADRFPKVMLVVIMVLAAMMLVRSLRGFKGARLAGKQPVGFRDALRPYGLFVGIVGYVGSMLLIGFFPATAGWGLLFMPLLEATRKKIYLGILTGTIVFIFFLFSYFLKVPLPTGILFE